jgi:hypothetical protein
MVCARRIRSHRVYRNPVAHTKEDVAGACCFFGTVCFFVYGMPLYAMGVDLPSPITGIKYLLENVLKLSYR